MSKKPSPSEPRPQCPECGRVLHPKYGVIVVSDDDVVSDDLPAGVPLHPDPTVFAGLYCSGDCVLDAFHRGWPEYRCMMR